MQGTVLICTFSIYENIVNTVKELYSFKKIHQNTQKREKSKEKNLKERVKISIKIEWNDVIRDL